MKVKCPKLFIFIVGLTIKDDFCFIHLRKRSISETIVVEQKKSVLRKEEINNSKKC